MILSFLKKFIVPFFVFTNLNQSLIAKDYYLFKEKKNSQNNKIKWTRVSFEKKQISPKNLFVEYKENSDDDSNGKKISKIKDKSKAKNISYKNKKVELEVQSLGSNNNAITEKLLPKQISYKNKKDELEIQSDTQSENNNTLYAEGNVLVSYRGKFLKADKLLYDKSTKTLTAKGDIKLIIGQQIFKINQIQYDIANKKGYLLNVNGLINTNNFVDDIIANFSDSDIKKIESLLTIKKEKVLYTPGKVNNWVFSAEKINIDDITWKTEKAVFTNDLLELKQVKIEINSLEATVEKEQLKFQSSLNYLILDEKLGVPFWFGKRSLTKSSEGFEPKNSWNVGYENLDKDGFYIGRKLNLTNVSDDFLIILEPQFLIQRAFKGYTKSFVKKGDSITGERIRRDATLSDYFAVNSEISGKVNTWDLKIQNQINSFDFAKFNDAFRSKSIISKKINFLNSNWESSFYLVYRDRIWNGSLGESEIYTGYGSKLEKQNTWEINGIKKTEVFSFGMANLKGEALYSKNLISSIKGNMFYSLDQKIPISVDNPSNKFIDSTYKYIYDPITKGLSLNTRMALSSSFYENGKHQEYVGLGAGPEFVFGNFKNKFFDYSRISLFPFYKIKSGESMFKFDQIPDKFTLDISFDQQLYGPLILNSSAIFNLDSDSSEYGDVINSKIALNWAKRSYELGIFYQPHNHAGGIAFSLFGFK